MGEHLSEGDKRRVIDILNEYRDCFALDLSELGKTNIAEAKIELTSSIPVYYKPYRVSYAERDKVRDIIDELKQHGIVRDSNSQYASPILLVKKKTGETRLCVDYRALNAITKKQRFPLPVIEDQVNSLQGAKIFSTFDLRSGYFQIPLAPADVEKTAFVTPDGHYEFLFLPFGIVTGPAECARLAQKVIKPLKGEMNVEAYFDDFCTGSSSIEEALEALRKFLQKIREVGLTLRLDKCTFLTENV